EPSHILRRDVDAGTDADWRVEAAGLYAGVVVRQPPARRQAQRILAVELVHRQSVLDDAEWRQPTALLGILLPEPGVQERRLRPVLVGERPLQPAPLLEQPVGHSMVRRRQRAQLVPDL